LRLCFTYRCAPMCLTSITLIALPSSPFALRPLPLLDSRFHLLLTLHSSPPNRASRRADSQESACFSHGYQHSPCNPHSSRGGMAPPHFVLRRVHRGRRVVGSCVGSWGRGSWSRGIVKLWALAVVGLSGRIDVCGLARAMPSLGHESDPPLPPSVPSHRKRPSLAVATSRFSFPPDPADSLATSYRYFDPLPAFSATLQPTFTSRLANPTQPRTRPPRPRTKHTE
jgi:hypothetical protein